MRSGKRGGDWVRDKKGNGRVQIEGVLMEKRMVEGNAKESGSRKGRKGRS